MIFIVLVSAVVDEQPQMGFMDRISSLNCMYGMREERIYGDFKSARGLL
jgi:hypothetical protein